MRERERGEGEREGGGGETCIPVTAPWWASRMTALSLRLSRSHTATFPDGLADATVLIPSTNIQ